ncbi:MAG TPA: 30S ribosomal protein S16 [Bellilinea sp.]|jgi:small subunit ribosomal protein S16|nr:30S ribosomal protein S16 [Bellilinea sp.]
MVRIRLRRTGLRRQASYRIIAADKESPRDGRFLEILGSYNPRTEPFTFEVNEERIYHWLKNGAQPSESVQQLFNSVGLTKRWERVKAGESAEQVLQEAAEFYANRKVNAKTNLA